MPLQELTSTEKTRNRALAAARAPVERGLARLKSWRIFRRSRCSPISVRLLADDPNTEILNSLVTRMCTTLGHRGC